MRVTLQVIDQRICLGMFGVVHWSSWPRQEFLASSNEQIPDPFHKTPPGKVVRPRTAAKA